MNVRRLAGMGVLSILALLGTIVPGAASAQGFRLGRWSGSLEFGVSRDRTAVTPGGREKSVFTHSRTEEQLSLRNSGAFILDPRLVNFDLGGTVGLFQDRLTGTDARSSSRGNLLGYDASANILPEKPFATTLFASRSTSTISREFAGTSDLLSETEGITTQLRMLPIPSVLGFQRSRFTEKSRLGGEASRRDETTKTISYYGSRQWENSDLALRYELDAVKNRLFPSFNYTTQTASISHRLVFGRNLDRILGSSLRYYARAGRTRFSSLNLDESLDLEHSETLHTNTRYLFSRIRTDTELSSSHTVLFHLRHRLYRSLTTVLQLNARRGTLPQGEQTSYGGGLNFSYRKNIFWNGKLLAGLGDSYEIQDSRLSENVIPIFQESHSVPPEMRFLLDNSRVDVSSIVITNADGSVIYHEGTDYALLQTGDQTEVDILLGGTIVVGQTVQVDYRFARSPSAKTSTNNFQGNLGFDFGWIYVYGSHSRTNRHLISGQIGPQIRESTTNTLGVQFRWRMRRLEANALNEFQKYDSTQFNYRSYRLSQNLTYALSARARLNLNTNESFFHYGNPERRSRFYSGALGFDWQAGASGFLSAFLRSRASYDTIAPKETAWETGVRGEWKLGKLDFIPSAEYDVRKTGENRVRDMRIDLRLVRRF